MKPTSAKEYAERYGKKTRLVTLPSGAVFEIRQIGPSDYIEGGLFPMLQSAIDVEAAGGDAAELLKKGKIREEDIMSALEFRKSVVISATVAPQIFADKEEAERCDGLWYKALTEDDFNALYMAIMEFGAAQPAPEVSLPHAEGEHEGTARADADVQRPESAAV